MASRQSFEQAAIDFVNAETRYNRLEEAAKKAIEEANAARKKFAMAKEALCNGNYMGETGVERFLVVGRRLVILAYADPRIGEMVSATTREIMAFGEDGRRLEL